MDEEKTSFLGQMNSWHWLVCLLTISLAIAGFSARVIYRKITTEDLPRLARAERTLAELKALDPDEPERLLREQKNFERARATAEAKIRATGLEEFPTNSACVFAIQNQLGAALAKHRLRIVSTSATDNAPKASSAASAKGAKSAKVAAPAEKPTRQMTADEYWAEMQKYANTLSGKDREMALASAKVKVAKMRKYEAEEAKRAALAQKMGKKTTATPSAAPKTVTRSAAPFHTENLSYEVEGRFRDIFLFFVEESYKKPAYNFCDIRVLPDMISPGQMKLFFTLQVNWK